MNHEHQLKFHEMQAMFHMFSAITGHTQSRKISQKTEDGYVELRPQEKINDAMETAKQHINLYRELAESIDAKSD